MRRTLFTIALPEEKFNIPTHNDINVIITKVGKACSAYALTKALTKFKPEIVVNMGSAGTVKLNVGDIVVSRNFYDRDLAPLAIEGVRSEIKSSGIAPFPSLVAGVENYSDFIVNTGDDFVTDSTGVKGDVIDMEAFAQAMVCGEEGIPFVAVKYITDKIGENSIKIWSEKLKEAQKALQMYVSKYMMPVLSV